MAGEYEGAVKTLQDLRAQETDQRVVRILDNFIHKIEMRAAGKKQESP